MRSERPRGRPVRRESPGRPGPCRTAIARRARSANVGDRRPDTIPISPLQVPQGRGPARRLAGRERPRPAKGAASTRPGQGPCHRRPRRGSVAAGHASSSGRRSRRLPTTRDPRGSIEAVSTVANGHSPTDRTCAGRRDGDRAWGDVDARSERPLLSRPPPRREETAERGPLASERRVETARASPRPPMSPARGCTFGRGAWTTVQPEPVGGEGPPGRPFNGCPPRRLTPAECNECTGPLAGADASSAGARAPGRLPRPGPGEPPVTTGRAGRTTIPPGQEGHPDDLRRAPAP